LVQINNPNVNRDYALGSESLPPVLGVCPVCGREFQVVRLHCAGCGIGIDGAFGLGRLQRLSAEQIRFVEVFLKCRGKIKDVEGELGISYPTVVSRLNEIIRALGFDVEPESDARSDRRQQILDDLAAGAISAAEAVQLLRAK
jgi:hypothetical protein